VQKLGTGRAAYLVPARGTVTVNGHEAGPRDGIAVAGEREIAITATEDAELVMVEVAEG
jgi:redox-sensitive bicupin YhaK (pirin superfamily)